MKSVSRRNFLKGALASAGAAATVGVPKPALAKPASGKELATLLDLSKCVGCEECVFACRESNEAKFPRPKKPFPAMHPTKRVKVSDWSEKTDVTDRLTPYNWLFVQSADVFHKGEMHEIHVPRRCMHCQNPPCANLCPFGAAAKRESGDTRINPDLCMGGAKCKNVCPWHIPQRQTGVGLYLKLLPGFAGNGVMYKCDRCYNLAAKGEQPACITACPEGVQEIGPRDKMLEKAKRLAKQMNGYIYGDKENGGTNTFYVSPVPFHKINKAMEKGPGRPPLKPVENSMETAQNLGAALMIAPFAGAAAAALSLISRAKKAGKDKE